MSEYHKTKNKGLLRWQLGIKCIIIYAFLVLSGCKDSSRNSEVAAEYLTQTAQSGLKESIARGALIYTDFCLQCHMPNGEGVQGTFPPLAQSDWLMTKRAESIHAVKHGQKGEITVNGESYNGIMVPMGLSDEEIADVLNYVMNSWGNSQDAMITPEEVAAIDN